MGQGSVRRVEAGDGAAIVYEVTGEGPDLVVVHGITESRRMWDPLVPRLAESHRVVAVDLRGHGESERKGPYDLATMAADVAAVAAAEGADTPDLLGHSLGGTVVTAYASAFPVRRVINVDQPLALAAFQAQLLAVEPMLRGEAFEAVMDQIFETLKGPLGPEERERLAAIEQPEQDVVLGVWDVLFNSSAEELDGIVAETFGGIEAPYLSLHGIDPGPDYCDWLGQLISGAQCEVWADQGHYPHLVSPDRFLARVEEFLV